MKILYLGGNSFGNREWIHEVENYFRSSFEEGLVIDYFHWEENMPNIQMDRELVRLESLEDSLGENYIVFAKSIGSILAIRAVKQGILKPKVCIFLGLPIMTSNQSGKHKELLADYKVPTLFIHKEKDPIGDADVVKKVLDKCLTGDYTFKKIPGDTHHYEDLEGLLAMTNEFLISQDLEA